MSGHEEDRDTLDSAPQRAMHGLLCSLYEVPSETRLRLATQRLQPRAPRMLRRAAAAGLFMAAGVLAGLVLESGLPEARAVVDEAVRRAEEEVDRRYRLTLQALRPDGPETLVEGTVHTRGRKFAIEFRAPFGRGWFGSDGATAWLALEGVPPLRWAAREPSRWPEERKMSFAVLNTYVHAMSDRFDFATIGRDEGGVVRVRASRKAYLVGEPVSRVDFWIDEAGGLIRQMQARIEPQVWHWEPWVVTFEHAGERPVGEGFYAPEAHLE